MLFSLKMDGKPITIADISKILMESPSLIAFKATELVERRADLDQAKLALSVAEAVATITYADKAKNQRILEAYIRQDLEVQKAEADVITSKVAHDLLKVEMEEIENKWISARKLAGLDEQERRMIRNDTIREVPPPPLQPY